MISKTPTGRAPPPPKLRNSEVGAVARDCLGAAWELLGGSWVPPEGWNAPWRPLGRLLGDSWAALGGFQEASWTKDWKSYNFARVFGKIMKFWGCILATFWHPNSDFWGLQEGIQDRADYEGVWASILERFSKAWERQK